MFGKAGLIHNKHDFLIGVGQAREGPSAQLFLYRLQRDSLVGEETLESSLEGVGLDGLRCALRQVVLSNVFFLEEGMSKVGKGVSERSGEGIEMLVNLGGDVR